MLTLLPTEFSQELFNFERRQANSLRKTCSPAILASCRQVYDEAADLLYAHKGVFVLTITMGHETHGVGLDFNDSCIEVNAEISLDRSIVWPRALLSAPSLCISIVAGTPIHASRMMEHDLAGLQSFAEGLPQWRIVNQALHDLYQQLQARSHLRELKINFDSGLSQPTRTLIALLSPLSALSLTVVKPEFKSTRAHHAHVAAGLQGLTQAVKDLKRAEEQTRLYSQVKKTRVFYTKGRHDVKFIRHRALTMRIRHPNFTTVHSKRIAGPLFALPTETDMKQAQHRLLQRFREQQRDELHRKQQKQQKDKPRNQQQKGSLRIKQETGELRRSARLRAKARA
jgi:hypothetical protein